MKSTDGNSTYKKLASRVFGTVVKRSRKLSGLCYESSSVVADSFHLRNSQLRKYAKRYSKVYTTTLRS